MYYSFTPVFLTVVGLYFVSYLLARKKVYSMFLHRQIWNVLLLLSFIGGAGFGGILQWQNAFDRYPIWPIHIKWWHVELSLVMAIIIVCHISWHWRYFLKIVRDRKSMSNKI
jgi:hypothetical protein